MRRLRPDERDIWEIKSHLKKPQLRVLGWFALPKWFVGVHCVLRDDLEETYQNGTPLSPRQNISERTWSALSIFFTLTPVSMYEIRHEDRYECRFQTRASCLPS
jgi:hypothetical protein